MEKYFEEIKQRVIRTIAQDGYPTKVPIGNYRADVISKFKILVPSLDKKRVITDFGTETITQSNPPLNIRYVPGEKVDFAQIAVPVLDNDTNILNQIFPQLSKMGYGSVIGSIGYDQHFIYKQYGRDLQTDENAQKDIKAKAKAYFDDIENKLAEAKNEAENFNEKVLIPLIDEKIEELKKSKNVKEDAMKKINPFT